MLQDEQADLGIGAQHGRNHRRAGLRRQPLPTLINRAPAPSSGRAARFSHGLAESTDRRVTAAPEQNSLNNLLELELSCGKVQELGCI
jgi:hypothetical protein